MTSSVNKSVDNLGRRAARGRLGLPLSRRLFLASAVTGAAALGLAACGGGGGGGAPTDAPLATDTGGFPVTLKGKEGTATIPAEPQRVIALGLQRDADTALALGVTPIAMAENTFIASPIAPWLDAKLAGQKPELINTTEGIPLEKIASLRPDLILATGSYELTDNYAELAQIAPTVSYIDTAATDSWQQRTTIVGKALGREEQARKTITDVEAKIKQAVQNNPAFAGKSFSFSVVSSREIFTVLEGDAAVIFLKQLGMTLAPEIAKLPTAGLPEPRSVVSLENISMLNADVVIITYFVDDDKDFVESSQLFQQFDAVKDGNYIPLNFLVSFALAFPSPLSIPYALDQVVPAVANVLA
ncbi:MAG: iron-siderophore ABC transporter substrate-binding protein [Pseudonocardiaceae bacterium]